MASSRQRRRSRISWFVLFALLFQQLALSAYACTLTSTPSEPVVAMANCTGMPMKASHTSSLCDKHCHPDNATASSLLSVTVPPLGLPPPAFAVVYHPLSSIDPRYVDVPISRSDPPPLLRFCSLQI
jgi:hypothetical protein